jgi:serine/threonine protein kinase
MNQEWLSSLLNQKQQIFDQYDPHQREGAKRDVGNVGSVDSEQEKMNSRYSKEFKEIAMVGWGGGGEVWMAMNYLDGRIYAVKKISLSSQDLQLNKKIRREVTTISGLLHAHVVRYYASWVEEVSSFHSPRGQEDDELWSESETNFSQSQQKPKQPTHLHSLSSSDSEESSNSLNYQPQNSSFEDFVFEASSAENSQLISQDHEVSSVITKHQGEIQSSQPPSTYRILYIQMEYCHATLQEAIADGQLCHNPLAVFRLFRQLLEAMKYIHSTRVIHRDMKVCLSLITLLTSFSLCLSVSLSASPFLPSLVNPQPANIFLDVTGEVKIGDFGLATTDIGYNLYGDIDVSLNLNEQDKTPPRKLPPRHPHQRPYPIPSVHCEDGGGGQLSSSPLSSTHQPEIINYHNGHTSGIGTALYRAPEQDVVITLPGPVTHSRMVYDSLVDIFSLGIILFELSHEPFLTSMERIETIKILRESHEVPPVFQQQMKNKYLIELILWMVNINPLHRPSAHEILESRLFQQWELSLNCENCLLDEKNELVITTPDALLVSSLTSSEILFTGLTETTGGGGGGTGAEEAVVTAAAAATAAAAVAKSQLLRQECYEKIDSVDLHSPLSGSIRVMNPSTSLAPVLLKTPPPALMTVFSHLDILEVSLPYHELKQFGTLISLVSTTAPLTPPTSSVEQPTTSSQSQSLFRQLQLFICEQKAESRVVMEHVLIKLVQLATSPPSLSSSSSSGSTGSGSVSISNSGGSRRYCILHSLLDSYYDMILYSSDALENYLEQRSG